MDRELKEVKISNGEIVQVITYLTWGEKEKIEASLIKGAKIGADGLNSFDAGVISDSKYIALNVCIKGIISPDGTKKQFSNEWMNNLSAEDGDLVYEAVNELSKKKG